MKINTTSYIVLWILLCWCTVPMSAQSTRLSEEMNKGMQAYAREDFSTALQHFTEVIRRDNGYPYVYTYRGNAYFALGQYRQALADYSTEIEQYTSQINRQGAALQRDELAVYGVAQLSTQQAAMLYNNRGTVRYFLGDQRGAIQDFQEALRLVPSLTTAQANLNKAYSNPIPPKRPQTNPLPNQERNAMAYQTYCARPTVRSYYASTYSQNNRNDEEALTLRYERGLHQKLVDPKLADRFRSPFTVRKVPRKGKTYPTPTVGGASQSYTEIASVTIKGRSTFVTLKVKNISNSDINMCIDDPGGAGAFYLTDRSGKNNMRFGYRTVKGVDVYPGSTVVKAGQTATIVLEFPRIPNTWGFVNLIEGERADGNAWNFYDIDLRE